MWPVKRMCKWPVGKELSKSLRRICKQFRCKNRGTKGEPILIGTPLHSSDEYKAAKALGSIPIVALSSVPGRI